MYKIFIAIFFAAMLSTGCKYFQSQNAENQPDIQLLNSALAEVQKFVVVPGADTVYEGQHGTLMVFPDDAFIDADGKAVKGNVTIKLVEALTPVDMILNGLSTLSDGKPLISGGMLYLKAFADGKEVFPNTAKPPYIQVPTQQRQAGMQVYKGKRDAKGNINWTDPRPMKNYLVHVDLELLNFYPPTFEKTVEDGMPLYGHTIADSDLKDSLYYSFSEGPVQEATDSSSGLSAGAGSASYESCRGIDPSVIKVIRDEKYQKTFIATHEFEERLQALFKRCNGSGTSSKTLLNVYVTDLGKDLWISDSIISDIADDEPTKNLFKAFREQQLTNIKDGDIYADRLSHFFDRKLKSVKKELQRLQSKADGIRNKHAEEYNKTILEYNDLVWKRETYRMTYYGYTWTENGWVNFDYGTEPKEYQIAPLDVTVNGAEKVDTVFTYLIYNSNQTLLMMTPLSKNKFVNGDTDQPMPKNSTGVVISVGMKGNVLIVAGVTEFHTITIYEVSVTLKEITKTELTKLLKKYNNYDLPENRIMVDIQYQKKLIDYEAKQQGFLKSDAFRFLLAKTIEPCCGTTIPSK